MNNNEVKKEEYWEIIERQEQQLLQLKSENEKLKKIADKALVDKNNLLDNKLLLTQKLEKARNTLKLGKFCSIDNSLNKEQLQTCFTGLMYFIKQALKELE